MRFPQNVMPQLSATTTPDRYLTAGIFNSSKIKLKNVSCEYDRWVVETQLCKLRDTLDTLIGRHCAMFQLKYGVCELHLRYGR